MGKSFSASFKIFTCLAHVPQYLFQELITIVLPDFFASVNFSKVKLVFFSTANELKDFYSLKNIFIRKVKN